MSKAKKPANVETPVPEPEKKEPEQNPLIPEERIPDPVARGVASMEDLKHIKIIASEPSPQFLQNVRSNGVHTPIWLEYKNSQSKELDNTRLIAGRRRLRACRIIDAEKANTEISIPYQIYAAGAVNPHVMAVIENAQRKENVVSSLVAVEAMLKSGATESDICDACGISRPQLSTILRLQRLTPGLRKLLLAGKLSVGVAHRAAILATNLQERLEEQINTGDSAATIADVSALRRVEIAKAASDLPDSMFQDPTLDWRGYAERDLMALSAKLSQLGAPKKVVIAVDSIVGVVRSAKQITPISEAKDGSKQTPAS